MRSVGALARRRALCSAAGSGLRGGEAAGSRPRPGPPPGAARGAGRGRGGGGRGRPIDLDALMGPGAGEAMGVGGGVSTPMARNRAGRGLGQPLLTPERAAAAPSRGGGGSSRVGGRSGGGRVGGGAGRGGGTLRDVFGADAPLGSRPRLPVETAGGGRWGGAGRGTSLKGSFERLRLSIGDDPLAEMEVCERERESARESK